MPNAYFTPPLVDQDTANAVGCSSVYTKLDYCNSILYGVSESNINLLQRVQNASALVLCAAPYRSPATHLRLDKASHKNAFRVRLHRQPAYLADPIIDYSQSWSLRSQGKDLLVVPWGKTQTASRAFWVAVPSIWNDLLIDIRSTATLISFRRQLKTLQHRVQLPISGLSDATDSLSRWKNDFLGQRNRAARNVFSIIIP